MSWIDTSQNETAADLLTRLQNLLADVPTQKATASSIAYSANGLVLRQVETTETTEFRSLTKAAAYKLASLDSDSTTTTVYYKRIGSSDEYAAAAVTTGEKTQYSAVRANEADGWHAIRTVQTFSAGSETGWSTTRPPGATSTGIVVSFDTNLSPVQKTEGDTLYLAENTTVREYRFLTKAEADAKVSSESTNTVAPAVYRHSVPSGNIYHPVNVGTCKMPSARYVDAENGYTVTVSEKVIAAFGDNWTLIP